MADNFPSDYVDPKAGEIKSLNTTWDKIESEGLVKGSNYALQAGKMALLAPVLGVFAVAGPVAAWVLARTKLNSLLNRVYDRSVEDSKYEGAQYDLTTPRGKQKFDDHFGHVQPVFPDDFLKMVQEAGLKEVPKIVVHEDMYRGFGMFGRSQSEYNAGAASRSDGKNATIEIGLGVMEEMTPGELRAIIGHEITHLALGHTKDRMGWLAGKFVSKALSIGLIGAAVTGFLPILPVVALVGVSWFTDKCLESINSRRREEQCDRGAAILCGGTEDLASGLVKLEKISKKALDAQLRQMSRLGRIFGLGGKADITLKEPSAFKKFMTRDHPENPRRVKLLEAFEQKYHDFCEKQRGQFAQTFNFKAKKPMPAKPKLPSLADLLGDALGNGGFDASNGNGSVHKLPGGGHVIVIRHPGMARHKGF